LSTESTASVSSG